MTAKELAEMLTGSAYGMEVTPEIEAAARENGLVIVFGYSDDCCELRGAIHDEIDCYDGGTIYLTADGIADWETPGARAIEALWCDTAFGAAWSYRTDIPHATFEVYEDDEIFCVGIVFALSDLGVSHDRERSILTAAIVKYGIEAQVLMAFEEMAELQKELCKNHRGKDNADAIADEIADVEIMLDQLKMIFGVEDSVKRHRTYKIVRLAKRLEDTQ